MRAVLEVANGFRSAPGDLEKVRQFINTKDIDGNVEILSSAEVLVSWLKQHHFPVDRARATDEDLELFLRLREGLRSLAMLNTESDSTKTAQGLVEMRNVVQRLGLRFHVDSHGRISAVPSGDGLERAAGLILLTVYHSMLDGSWARMKACTSDTCRWAFYDGSKNHTGKWCDMAVCGNRNKVNRYLARERATTPQKDRHCRHLLS